MNVNSPEIRVPRRLHARVRAAISREEPVPPRAPWRNLVALAITLSLIAMVVVFASEIVYRRPVAGLTFGIRSVEATVVTAGALLTLVSLATLAALRRGRSGLGAGVNTLLLVALLVPLIHAALVLPAPVHEWGVAARAADISPWGLRCFLMAGLVGALAMTGFGFVLRRAAPVATRLRAAAVGAAAGGWAGLAVFVFCPSGDQQHLAVGHVMPVFALAAVAVMVLSSRLRP